VRTLIRAGWLIDGPGHAPIPDAALLVEGGVIAATGPWADVARAGGVPTPRSICGRIG